MQDGSAAGLLLFLDQEVLSRSIDMATGRACRTAVRRVLGSTGVALDRIDIRKIDVDDAWHRFQTSESASTVSPASLPSYRARLRKSVVRYRNWLEHGDVPTSADRMVDYPFPVRDGVRATLRLPERLSEAEAARLASFVTALAVRADSPDGG